MTLQEAREGLKLKMAELDRLAGVPRRTTFDIETGRNRNPSWRLVSRLVKALQDAGLPGVTADQLFSDVIPTKGSEAQEEVRS